MFGSCQYRGQLNQFHNDETRRKKCETEKKEGGWGGDGGGIRCINPGGNLVPSPTRVY